MLYSVPSFNTRMYTWVCVFMTMYLCPRPGIDDVNITSLGVKRELPDVQAGF